MYLGVDGGGTKTAFVLIDQNGHVLSEHVEPTCYHIQVGIDGAKKVIQSGISNIFRKAKKDVSDLTYAFFGLPAFGEDSQTDKLVSKLPSTLIPETHYQCDNDMVNGWAAAFGGSDGINIVAGTGSIAFGMRQKRQMRCGGWGELFSDEGSAYWIAIKGLNAFSQMADGRLKKGPLYHIIKHELGIEQDLDMTGLVLSQWQGDRSQIASVSTLVVKALEQGDETASGILQEAGKELAKIINGTHRALGFSADEAVHLSYSGGVFRSKSAILQPMTEALSQYSCNYVISAPIYTPVIGAALFACRMSNYSMPKEGLERLRGERL